MARGARLDKNSHIKQVVSCEKLGHLHTRVLLGEREWARTLLTVRQVRLEEIGMKVGSKK